jgi:hypothetical protein
MLAGMAARKYPLDALARVRGARVDAASRSLAVATRAREEAAAKRLGAQAKKDGHEQGVRATKATERTALEDGTLHAGDLARADAWGLRAALEGQALAATLEQARAGESKAAEAHAKARRETAERSAEERVVARHREAWDAARRAAVDAADEEAAAEAWRPRG